MDFYGGSYDFSSIMHYGNYAFSKNKRPTMLSVKDPLLQFGQIAKLSPTDILQLNALYDCRSKYSYSGLIITSNTDCKISGPRERLDYRALSLTWSVRWLCKFIGAKFVRVLAKDWFGTPTWWPRRYVKTLYDRWGFVIKADKFEFIILWRGVDGCFRMSLK